MAQNLRRLPTDYSDFVCPINKLIVSYIVLKILIVLDLPLAVDDFIKEVQATVNHLVSEIVNDSVPNASNSAAISADG
jgi:hypothetical protein